jgi:hypothetical protein
MEAELSGALRELELSTDALLGADTADLGRLSEALKRRARAVTRVAALGGELGRHGPEAVRRLGAALDRGDEATQKVLSMKQDAADEWARLQRIARGLDEGRPEAARQVDFSG